MVDPDVRDRILADLERLTPEQQKQAAAIVRRLVEEEQRTEGQSEPDDSAAARRRLADLHGKIPEASAPPRRR